MRPAFEHFYGIIGYRFQQEVLVQEAMTHPSSTRDRKDAKTHKDYERLEFLGDAILGFVVAELLLTHFPEETEGGLAKRLAVLVSGAILSDIARNLKVGEYLILAPGEESTGGRDNSANLENALEALIGALYLDGGLEVVKQFVHTHWLLKAREMTEAPKDPKTALQEWSQGLGKPIPSYKTIHTEGPSHAPIFTVEVNIPGVGAVQAKGNSKRTAEREAAQLMLAAIGEEKL